VKVEDLDFLEESWEVAHCEYEHEGTVCLHTPVLRFGPGCQGELALGCRNVQSIYEQRRSNIQNKCGICKQSCRDCWRVYPL